MKTALSSAFALILVVAMQSIPAEAQLFGRPLYYRAALGTYFIAVGDFNGDGSQDMVVTGFTPTVDANVFVLLNDGHGNFLTPIQFKAGNFAGVVTAGDFNGDGKLDLVIVNSDNALHSDNTVSVALGNGDGTFQPAVSYPAGALPLSIAVGDFNGDGALDLAVGNALDGTVSILLGNGDGTFQPAVNYFVGAAFGPGPFDQILIIGLSLAVGDVNGDGNLDLIVADAHTNRVNLLLGNGDGTFQPRRILLTEQVPRQPVLADVNGDGNLDLLFLDAHPFEIAEDHAIVLLGNGDGTFQPETKYTIGIYGDSIALADFNGDGKIDLAVEHDDHVAILSGNGDGTFQDPQNYSARGIQLVVADFNGDGKPDLATEFITVLLNGVLPESTVCLAPPIRYAVRKTPTSVAAGDFNGDGKLDLAVASYSFGDPQNGGVSILLGYGDGTFQPATTAATGRAVSVMAADFNSDGKLDLAVRDEGGVRILLGNGDGTFQAPISIAVGSGERGSIAVGDFNGDGKLDMAVTDFNVGKIVVLLGNGDGTFTTAGSYGGLGTVAHEVAVGDFNSDGRLDIVSNGLHGPVLFLGNGDGTFQPPITVSNTGELASIAVGDFNGDGKADLAVTAELGNDTTVLLGRGDGSFETGVLYPPGIAPLMVADLNGDGKLDLVGAYAALLNNGDGTFQHAMYFGVTYAYSVAIGDFDGDGKLDLAVTGGYAQDTVQILLNRPCGPASHFVVTVPASATQDPVTAKSGQALSVYVAAVNDFGAVNSEYIGSTHFTSTDTAGFMPPDYTFTYDDSGAHILSAALITVGNQTITATDKATPSITGLSNTITVDPASTATVLSSSPNPSQVGQAVAFTAVVVPQYSGVPTGTVTFNEGASTLGTATLDGSRVAIFSTTALVPGPHTITAVYDGDSRFLGSTSNAVNQIVQ